MPRRRAAWTIGVALGFSLSVFGLPGGSRAEPKAVAEAAAVEIVDAIPTGPTLADRLAEIQRRISRALVYPPIARVRGLEGVARVRFEIRPDGEAKQVQVAGSSGHYVLDRAAEKSVRRAAPLPWVSGRLEVPVRFSLERAR